MKAKTRVMTAAVVTVAAAVAGCSSGGQPAADGKPRVAIVLGGLAGDGGFNSYGADVVRAMESEGLATAHITESLPQPAEAENVLRQHAADGADLVIGWGYGYTDSLLKLADEFPETSFLATGGQEMNGKQKKNLETWTFAAEELGYLMGVMAGETQLSPVGVVDGEKVGFIEATWCGFSQGLRATNPAAQEIEPRYTGNFEDPGAIGQAATTQIQAGAKLIAASAEGYAAGVATAANSAGVATIGLSSAAGDHVAMVNVGNVKIDMNPVLRPMLTRVIDNTFGNQFHTSSIANESLVMSPINRVSSAPGISPGAEAHAAAQAERIASGQLTLTPFSPGTPCR